MIINRRQDSFEIRLGVLEEAAAAKAKTPAKKAPAKKKTTQAKRAVTTSGNTNA